MEATQQAGHLERDNMPAVTRYNVTVNKAHLGEIWTGLARAIGDRSGTDVFRNLYIVGCLPSGPGIWSTGEAVTILLSNGLSGHPYLS